MGALFQVGQKVVSRVDEQGLTKGKSYTVTDVVHGKFGVVYYELDHLPNLVVNGHFVLDDGTGAFSL